MILKTVAASMCLAALTNVTHVPPTQTPAFDASGVVYEATHDLTFTPVAVETSDGTVDNLERNQFALSKGEVVILEDAKIDANGESLTRFGIEDADPTAPTAYWIRTNELSNVDLRVAVKTYEQLFSATPGLTNAPDEEFEVTKEARRHGWGPARRARSAHYCTTHPRSPRCCKSAVNYMLLRWRLVKVRVGGLAARDMARGLAQQHWREVGCGARRRPTKGMTCTYRGGTSGHTESWTGRCWYYGAKCTPTPMDQANRRCFSCKVPGRR